MNRNITTRLSSERQLPIPIQATLCAEQQQCVTTKPTLKAKNLPEMTNFENETKVRTWFSKVYHRVFEKNG